MVLFPYHLSLSFSLSLSLSFSLSPQYDTLEAAVATRTRLHGIKWPVTNPKVLVVDFLSAEEALKLTDGELVIPSDLLQVRETKETPAVVEETKKEEDDQEKEMVVEAVAVQDKDSVGK